METVAVAFSRVELDAIITALCQRHRCAEGSQLVLRLRAIATRSQVVVVPKKTGRPRVAIFETLREIFPATAAKALGCQAIMRLANDIHPISNSTLRALIADAVAAGQLVRTANVLPNGLQSGFRYHVAPDSELP